MYRLKPAAIADIESILRYLDMHNSAAAERYHRDFMEAFTQLAARPMQGQAMPEINPTARHWVIPPYRIFYRIIDPDIEIMRVLHGARRITPRLLA